MGQFMYWMDLVKWAINVLLDPFNVHIKLPIYLASKFIIIEHIETSVLQLTSNVQHSLDNTCSQSALKGKDIGARHDFGDWDLHNKV